MSWATFGAGGAIMNSERAAESTNQKAKGALMERGRGEPSHQTIVEVIRMEVASINKRLDRGESRFDKLEEKMDRADIARMEMKAEIDAVKTGVESNRVAVSAYLETHKTPPWYMGWKPVAIGLALALFAGAGLTALAIAGLDIVPKLTAIKNAVQP